MACHWTVDLWVGTADLYPPNQNGSKQNDVMLPKLTNQTTGGIHIEEVRFDQSRGKTMN